MMNDVLNYSDFINSQSKDAVISHPDVQKSMLMLLGAGKNEKLELSKEEGNKIAQNYQKMFVALSIIRWCNGETLGVARQKSLEQMNAFVKSKTNIAHPMNKYLMVINNQIIREISQRNMTDENSNKKLNMDSNLAKKWSSKATDVFQQCMRELNDMYKKYMPEQDKSKQPGTVKFELANKRVQDLMQKIIIEQRTQQRAA